MQQFNKCLDDLVGILTLHKKLLTDHLKKNYKINYHYIIDNSIKPKTHGGQNKINYILTEEAYDLFKNSFNFRTRYITEISDTSKVKIFSMCIENQTIGFIENTFKDLFKMKKQYMIGNYRIDLFFIDYKLAIECDENNHNNRDKLYEKTREEFIISQGNQIIRFNPNENNFDISNVINKIIKVIMK